MGVVLTQTLDQNIMKLVLALLFLAAVAFPEASAWYGRYYGHWGYPYRYYVAHPKPATKEAWVDGYGYAIVPNERKRRDATAVAEPAPEPAVLASTSSIPGGVQIVQPYALGATLVGAVPINPTAAHKGTEVIPGAVTEGEPIASPGVVQLGYGLPVHGWGYGYGVPHPPVLAAAPVAAPVAAPAEAPAAVDVRKKREAEAEAEADPEAWYYGHYGYGGYGGYYGLGYGYGGYYGHPYGYGYRYGWGK